MNKITGEMVFEQRFFMTFSSKVYCVKGVYETCETYDEEVRGEGYVRLWT